MGDIMPKSPSPKPPLSCNGLAFHMCPAHSLQAPSHLLAQLAELDLRKIGAHAVPARGDGWPGQVLGCIQIQTKQRNT